MSALLFLTLSDNAYAQICSISEYPYGFAGSNRPRMHGDDFKAVPNDLPFIAKTEHRPRYSEFWINTDVLNIRTGPSLEHEIQSETYYGNLVFAYAKIGDWVAISTGLTYDDIEMKPKWVKIEYLSTKRIEEQVVTEVLKRKCSFRQLGESSAEHSLNDAQNNIFNACGAVVNYLTEQNYLSKIHPYYDEYYSWRRSQKNPENYRTLLCDRRR